MSHEVFPKSKILTGIPDDLLRIVQRVQEKERKEQQNILQKNQAVLEMVIKALHLPFSQGQVQNEGLSWTFRKVKLQITGTPDLPVTGQLPTNTIVQILANHEWRMVELVSLDHSTYPEEVITEVALCFYPELKDTDNEE